MERDSEKKCDFALMLACMRKIKDGSYVNVGIEDKNSNHNIVGYLKAFCYLANQNKCLDNAKTNKK